MRCLIHDFAGHPFQVQLSRELAARGHYVAHAFPTGLPGPKGRLEPSKTDSDRLSISPIALSGSFRKYSPSRRFVTQRQYARDMKALIGRHKPDVVLSGNTPIDVQAELLWHCRRNDIGFVHWVQDVYCHAIEFFLRRKFKGLAGPMSMPFRSLEKTVAARSNSTVVIAPAFKTLLAEWGIAHGKIRTIENWAPLDEVPPLPRQNAWAAEHGLGDKPVFLYSGTLGLKHRPDLLYDIAKTLGNACKVVVISEGVGRDFLEKMPRLDNLLLLKFQPYERLPEVLASADVLLATLEADAGQFAVPSKILTYLCAGRPLLLAAPKTNLAASVVQRSQSGMVVDSDDTSAWLEAARTLCFNEELRMGLARNARAYAEETFDIQKIGSAFEETLLNACGTRTTVPSIQTAPERLQS
jgi:glycosyltransferase involved in cell wall biosynthesis